MSWDTKKLRDVLDYEQPTKYIVQSTDYDDEYKVPVLTAGKSFLLGYTNENEGVFKNVPVIIFDDFTTAFHFVDFPFKVKSSAMKILKTDNSKNDLKFLYYQMTRINIDTQLHKRYWISKFSNQEFDCPPLEVQKHIAQILDDAVALRDKTIQLLKEYDALAQSIFLDMFGDPVMNPKGWPLKSIEEIVKKEKSAIKRGPFGGALKKEIFKESGYLVYEQFHALNNDFSFKRYFIDGKDFKRLESFKVLPGDILISCSGVYLGKLAIVPENALEGVINQALLKITLDESLMLNIFFVYQFRQERFRNKYFGLGRGSGIPNFPPMKTFKSFPFIFPPIDIQIKFAEKIELIEQQKELAKKELSEAEDLFNCLLQMAFKGELVK